MVLRGRKLQVLLKFETNKHRFDEVCLILCSCFFGFETSRLIFLLTNCQNANQDDDRHRSPSGNTCVLEAILLSTKSESYVLELNMILNSVRRLY